jgi:hypothetical protein
MTETTIATAMMVTFSVLIPVGITAAGLMASPG